MCCGWRATSTTVGLRPRWKRLGPGSFAAKGQLTDLRTVAVGDEELVARRAVVIANGSTAAIPPIPGLDSVDFWTNRQAAIPRELPVSLAILGGGAIGVELGQAFARLGCRVHMIEAGPTFLGLEEPEAGAALRPHLEERRHHADDRRSMCRRRTAGAGAVARRLQRGGSSEVRGHGRADRLLVATGRRSNVEAWRGAGLAQTERGWLKVDPSTLEAQPGVFGAGDVTGLGGFKHLAYYHGQIVARRLRGIDAEGRSHGGAACDIHRSGSRVGRAVGSCGARPKASTLLVARANPAETSARLHP